MLRPRLPIALLILACLLTLGLMGWHWYPPATRSPTDRDRSAPRTTDIPLSPRATSPYQNTDPAVAYVGTAACARCHPDTHQSYHDTMMSRSMAVVDVSQEPADDEFVHARSGRRYRIYRDGSQLRQQEFLTGLRDGQGRPAGDELLADFPVNYVVGSGHFSRSYFSEIDGFLVEAPATWFSARQGWDVSPGYDRPLPDGFERAATENCLYCHAGRIEALEGSLHKIRIHEAAIGCERCHGPGELHVRRWETASQTGDPARSARRQAGPDFTIVNPADLPRKLAEAVCQQCHLTSDAQVTARGRTLSEFRPGLPLEDFFLSYRVADAGHSMKVVGHFDQMSHSACYQRSDSLTCLTCHNPHDKPRPEERAEYFGRICASCHAADACPEDVRLRPRPEAGQNCVTCHMPQVSTEIVHLAFTHHRIGIHKTGTAPAAPTESPEAVLEPWQDLSRLNEIDRIRSLGLAYYDRAYDPGPHSNVCFQRARQLLETTRARGLEEGAVLSALAQIQTLAKDSRAVIRAEEALHDAGLPAVPRIRALSILANDHYQQQRYPQALEALDELSRLRRYSADRALAGYCRLGLGDTAQAILAFEQAVKLNPGLLPVHRELVNLYLVAGQPDRAARQKMIGERLRQLATAPDTTHSE